MTRMFLTTNTSKFFYIVYKYNLKEFGFKKDQVYKFGLRIIELSYP